MRFSTHLFILLLFPGLPAGARMSMELNPRTISVDETAVLTLKFEGGAAGGAPEIPLPQNLRVRSTSRSGRQVNQHRETFFQYELQATEPGEYAIGPFTMTLEGQATTVGPVTLTVTPARVINTSEELFMTLEVNQSRALIHQPVDINVTLFSRYQLDDIQLAEFDTNGLDMGDWQTFQRRDQVIDGERFQVRRFSARATPVASGSYTLSPTFLVQVLIPDEEMTRDRFGMLSRRATRRSVRLQPDPVVLEVEPPPREGRPESFSGALGQFTFEASASPLRVNVGDPITLRVQIEGFGNMRNLLPPSLAESDDFQVFTPRLIEENLTRDGSRGRKVIEQVIVPRHAEVDRIPEFTFSFFNPNAWEYQVRTAGPFELVVSPAPAREPSPLLTGAGSLRLGRGPTLLGEDLMYLKSSLGTQRPLQTNPLFFTAVSALPLALWALTGLWISKRETLEKDPALARQRQAPRKLRKQLISMESADDPHEAMWSCLAEYLGDRFRIPPGEVEPSRIDPHLQNRVSEKTREAIHQWLRVCERARFTGGTTGGDRAETIREFSEFMLGLNEEAGR